MRKCCPCAFLFLNHRNSYYARLIRNQVDEEIKKKENKNFHSNHLKLFFFVVAVVGRFVCTTNRWLERIFYKLYMFRVISFSDEISMCVCVCVVQPFAKYRSRNVFLSLSHRKHQPKKHLHKTKTGKKYKRI